MLPPGATARLPNADPALKSRLPPDATFPAAFPAAINTLPASPRDVPVCKVTFPLEPSTEVPDFIDTPPLAPNSDEPD